MEDIRGGRWEYGWGVNGEEYGGLGKRICGRVGGTVGERVGRMMGGEVGLGVGT